MKLGLFLQILPSKFLLSPDADVLSAAALVLESLLLQTVIFLGFGWTLKQI